MANGLEPGKYKQVFQKTFRIADTSIAQVDLRGSLSDRLGQALCMVALLTIVWSGPPRD